MKSDNQTLQNTAQSKKQLLQTFKYQLGQQSQFLSRVITFYQGFSPDLDAELKILCEHLYGKFDFSLIDQSMSTLTGLLLQNSDVIKQQNTNAKGMLKNAIKTLHDLDDIQQYIENRCG
jgi:hypothetical protein